MFPVTHLGGVTLPLAFKFYVGNLVKEKVRHAGIRNVRIFQLYSETDLLVVAASEVEGDIPPLWEVEPTRLPSGFAQVGRR